MKTYKQKRKKPEGKKLNRILRRNLRGYFNIGCYYTDPYNHLLKFRELNIEP